MSMFWKFKFTLYIIVMTLLGAGDVRFSLRNTTYQNNSLVTLEDIGEGDGALDCKTNQTTCYKPCQGNNWFFPNETRVPSAGQMWYFYRTRGDMAVSMHRRRGGEEGIYHCVIPDSTNVNQTIYIGVYTTNTGEGHWALLGTLILFPQALVRYRKSLRF